MIRAVKLLIAMAIPELYSSRLKKSAGLPDVFTYDYMPSKLKVQISFIITDALGNYWRGGNTYEGTHVYNELHDKLIRHLGVTTLDPKGHKGVNKQSAPLDITQHIETLHNPNWNLKKL